MIYGTRSNGKAHGLVLTKPIVVDSMLDKVGYTSSMDLSTVKIVEPAAGKGAFAIPIIERLYQSSIKFNFSFQKALSNILLYEIDEEMVSLLEKHIESQLSDYSAKLPETLINKADFLLTDIPSCNIVIGNPPYVRHENIPTDKKSLYKKKFGTFTHRSDLYIAFYEKSLRILNNNGILSFICSNRWLKNLYGQNLRKFISLSYSLDEIIDLEGTHPFEEDVIAYPAITIIKNSTEKAKPVYYQIQELEDLIKLDNLSIPKSILKTNYPNNWFSFKIDENFNEKYLDSIEGQGFKIGIGVATGLDKVFIHKGFDQFVEEELLLPILTSKDLRSNKFEWSGKFILNPFSANGDLIDLEKYPKGKSYLNSHKELLLKRHVSKRNPENWYKTIDRIVPELTYKEKIILPDISGNSCLFIDRGNYYPHHNLYYITDQPYHKLVLLAAILMSDFVKDQLFELGNKMNGGYPRWQSQNLKRLKVPIIDSIPENFAQKIISAYHQKNILEINRLIKPSEMPRCNLTVGQTKLF